MEFRYKSGWLQVVDEGVFVENLIHCSAVTSEITPQVRMAAELGKILNLEIGDSHRTPYCTVVKLDKRTFMFKVHRITCLKDPEITASYIFFIEDFHKVLEKLARLMV